MVFGFNQVLRKHNLAKVFSLSYESESIKLKKNTKEPSKHLNMVFVLNALPTHSLIGSRVIWCLCKLELDNQHACVHSGQLFKHA